MRLGISMKIGWISLIGPFFFFIKKRGKIYIILDFQSNNKIGRGG
jgi:hypothetical protein